MSQKLYSVAEIKNGMDSYFIKKFFDRIYRIVRKILFPVSGRNRKYSIRFAE